MIHSKHGGACLFVSFPPHEDVFLLIVFCLGCNLAAVRPFWLCSTGRSAVAQQSVQILWGWQQLHLATGSLPAAMPIQTHSVISEHVFFFLIQHFYSQCAFCEYFHISEIIFLPGFLFCCPLPLFVIVSAMQLQALNRNVTVAHLL